MYYDDGNDVRIGDVVAYRGRPQTILMMRDAGAEIDGHEYFVPYDELQLLKRGPLN